MFPIQVNPLNLEFPNQIKIHYCGLTEFPDQNLRQIGPEVPEILL